MTDDPVLDETLSALAMRSGVLRRWLEDRRRFCLSHGGRRYYAEVLDLVEDCQERLSRRESGGGQSPALRGQRQPSPEASR